MTSLERALTEMKEAERCSSSGGRLHRLDPRAKVVVTLLYVGMVLSFSLDSVAGLLLFGVFPIFGSALAGIDFSRVFRRSLLVLPFIVLIGAFNPMLRHEPALYVGSTAISEGWVELCAIVLRGLLSVQALLLLVMTTGFINVCHGLNRLGVPAVFTTQLLLVYRYIYVLVEEAIDMDRARKSRSYGRKGYGLKMWGTFVGQLLLRTVGRAQRLHRAMLSRGFTGALPLTSPLKWRRTDTVFVAVAAAAIVALRLINVNAILHFPI